STGAPGSNALVTNVGTSSAASLDFVIPRGDPGINGTNGSDGAAATVAVGTTTTGAPGSNASVTNSGTSSAAVFNFTVPRGDTGATGPAGPSVVTPVAARSAAYSTAYQTSSLTKPSFISAIIDVTHSVAL